MKNIHLTMLITSLVYIFVVFIIFSSKKKISNDDTVIYSKMLWVVIFSIILELLLANYVSFLYGKIHMADVIFLYISKLFVSVVLYWFFLVMHYTITLYKKINSATLQKLESKEIYLYLFLSIIIMILPVEFIPTKDAGYTTGAATGFAFGCIILCLAIIIFLLVKLNKHLRRKEFIPIFILIILMIISTLIQASNPELLLFNPIISLVTILMYFTIENPDVKMVKQLEEANRTAEKANRAKTEFLSSMSHEIRTPLNAIIGFSEAIKEDTTVEQCHEDADDIIMAGQNLLEIINGILDISKIEANKMEIVNVNYNLKETCNNIAKLIKPRIGEKPIELKVNIASDIPDTLYGDSGKIKEVITNILTNAVKYTDEGFIEFNVSCINQGDTSTLFISIEDSGRGIKKEHLEKLFSKFQRLEEDRNTTIEGTGLGLAITKSLVEMMGGRIIVQSKYGRGSKFSVYLKQQIVTMVENKEEVKETVKTDSISFADKKVLIVDDNNLNLKVAARLLKEYDLDPELVSSGFECLDKINAGSTYDLILLDDMMPKMSGVETFKKLKEIEGFNIPTVILTANAISGMKEKYLEEGFNDYLAKPIDKGELKRVLNDYLNK